MKKSILLLLVVLFLSCSSDDGPTTPAGDSIVSVTILAWRDLGTVCEAPKDVNGVADLEVTFNGRVPSNGRLSFQSKWRLPEETTFTFEEQRFLNVADLSSNGNRLTMSNGYCWGLEDSVVSAEFKYIAADGTESELLIIPIPRPE